MSRPARQRVDFHKVLEDIAFLELTGEALAQRLEVRRGVLQGFATGTRVLPPSVQHRLSWLWSHLTGKPVEFLPRTTDAEDAPRPEVEGLDSDDPPERPLADREAVALLWEHITRWR